MPEDATADPTVSSPKGESKKRRAKRRSGKGAGAYHHGDLRAALLAASLELVQEGGVAALSLRKAAKKAGVSAAAPYHHFESRGALLAALATEGFGLLHREMEAASQGVDDEGDQLGACGRAYVRFARKHPAHFKVMFRPELTDRSAYPDLEAASAPVFEALVERVVAAQGAGAVPVEQTEGLVLLAWSVAHGLASLLVDGPLGESSFDKVSCPTHEMGDLVIDVFARMLRAAAEPAHDPA